MIADNEIANPPCRAQRPIDAQRNFLVVMHQIAAGENDITPLQRLLNIFQTQADTGELRRI